MLDYLFIVLVVFVPWVYLGIVVAVISKTCTEDKLKYTFKQKLSFVAVFFGLYIVIIIVETITNIFHKVTRLIKKVYTK